MPDCRLKYQIIVERAKQRQEKFRDVQFPANDSSIGADILGSRPNEYIWKCASDNNGIYKGSKQKHRGQRYSIFKDGVDVNDIQQGQLGDCYYLSALAVLGSEHTQERFVFVDGPDEWLVCGAFCVRFYDNGKENIVIIDDFFPTVDQNYPFVSSSDRTELWPIILEKAYAKKYGSYSIIEGGFTDLALSELTNGIPEKIPIEEDTNTVKLWQKLHAL